MSFPSQGYIPSTVPIPILKDSVSALARNADQEWFASDIIPTPADNFASNIIFVFAYSVRAIIEVSLDSGTTWVNLNNNNKVEAESFNSFEVPVLNIDQVTIRADTAGTIRFARAFEIGGT